jgi:C4-dicarboxylate-binding protein DctP
MFGRLRPTTLRAALLGCALATSVAAMPAQAQTEMVITDELATSHWTTGVLDELGRTIEEATAGRVKPRVFHAGTLYNDQDAIAALGTGAVHMVWPVAVRLETIAPEAGVLSLPFAIDDEMMAKPGAPEAVAGYLQKYLEPRGIRVMGIARTADLFFLTRDEHLAEMADLQGMKIRATGGRVLLDLLGKFGASSVALPAPEMGPALSQGAIDGALTSAGGWEMAGINAVPYATLVPGLNLVTYAILVDDQWLQGLPEDARAAIETTMTEFVRDDWQRAKALDQQALDKMIGEGGSFATIEGEKRQEFVDAAEAITAQWREKHPEAWEEFQTAIAPFK